MYAYLVTIFTFLKTISLFSGAFLRRFCPYLVTCTVNRCVLVLDSLEYYSIFLRYTKIVFIHPRRREFLLIMAIWVVKFQREGYKISLLDRNYCTFLKTKSICYVKNHLNLWFLSFESLRALFLLLMPNL